MNSKDCLDLLMYNQKKVRDGFKFIDLNTHEEVSIEDCYENIKKDLEVLDILKKNIHVVKQTKDQNGTLLGETIGLWLHSVDEDYTKVKEWLDQ